LTPVGDLSAGYAPETMDLELVDLVEHQGCGGFGNPPLAHQLAGDDPKSVLLVQVLLEAVGVAADHLARPQPRQAVREVVGLQGL